MSGLLQQPCNTYPEEGTVWNLVTKHHSIIIIVIDAKLNPIVDSKSLQIEISIMRHYDKE